MTKLLAAVIIAYTVVLALSLWGNWPSLVKSHNIKRVQCDTDINCMQLHGGDGSPG